MKMKKLLSTLYITTPEIYLALDGENVVILQENSEIGRAPLHNLDSIVTFGYSGASPALMGKCVKKGIPISFMSRNGKFLARIEGEVNGNVLLRRDQYRIADDDRSLEIARNMIAAKLYNSKNVLNRTMRDHGMRIDRELFGRKSEFLQSQTKNALNAVNKDSLRGIEGEGASVYFSVFDDMILQQKKDFYFHTRNKRPPLNNVNAMLSFAYTLTAGMCASALEAVGLDPYVGFLHTDRPGRRSLALDLMEEFRAPMCDRFVLTLINKKLMNCSDFIQNEDGAVSMTDTGRKKFITSWQNRKNDEIKHSFLGEKMQWGMLPYVQALLLSRYIRGDLDSYPPFFWK